MVLIILVALSWLSYKAWIFGTSFSMPCMNWVYSTSLTVPLISTVGRPGMTYGIVICSRKSTPSCLLSTVRGMDLSLTQLKSCQGPSMSCAFLLQWNSTWPSSMRLILNRRGLVIPESSVGPFKWWWTLSRQLVRNSMCSVYFMREQEFFKWKQSWEKVKKSLSTRWTDDLENIWSWSQCVWPTSKKKSGFHQKHHNRQEGTSTTWQLALFVFAGVI